MTHSIETEIQFHVLIPPAVTKAAFRMTKERLIDRQSYNKQGQTKGRENAVFVCGMLQSDRMFHIR